MATGLRLNELRELRLADVHIQRPIEESYLFVRADTSKSKASRQVRLDRIAAEAVVAYVKDWRPDKGDNATLLLTEEGKTFTPSGVDTYMARIGARFEAAGIRTAGARAVGGDRARGWPRPGRARLAQCAGPAHRHAT